MKTKSLFVAAVAIMMAACSETDNISVQNTAQQAETAVSFDTYTAKALTRAGAVGEIVTKEDLQVNNFGVFAYYHDGSSYYTSNKNENDYFTATQGAKNNKPDFMWNQKVEYDGDNWFYFPVKYWPNESNSKGDSKYVDDADPNGNNASTIVTTAPDKLSFFAYAPYVEASTSGAVTPNADGITAIFDPQSVEDTPPSPLIMLNTLKADPYIAYKTPNDPLKTVDLLWGVVPSFKTKYSTVVKDGDKAEQTVEAGFPNYNLVKQTTDERIMFQFKHALAKLTINVKGFFDDVPEHGAHSETNDGDASDQSENNVAKDTKIVVEYVKLSTDKYANNSVLNLNNHTVANKPNWIQSRTDAAGTAEQTINFEISGNMLANLIRYRTPSAPEKGYAEQPRGVTKDAVALLANDASQEAFFGIIPQFITGKENSLWTVEVKYHVYTKDANLENGYSHITNVIKKENISLGNLAEGKHYTLQLRLGMTSVKFDATVEDWIEGTTTPADLPINVAVASITSAPLKTTVGAASGSDTYSDESYSAVAATTGNIEVENCKSIISIDGTGDTKFKVQYETNSTDYEVSPEGATLNSDVDWIHYDGANFIVEENRTASARSGKVWVTYGGVNSTPVTVTQHASVFSLALTYTTGGGTTKQITSDDKSAIGYTVTAKYKDSDGDKYIDCSVDANQTGSFSYTNWIKIAKTADAATGTVQATSNNEDAVNSRTATITVSYDGVNSSITLEQLKVGATVTP